MFAKSTLTACLFIWAFAINGVAGLDYSSTEVASGEPRLISPKNAPVRLSSPLVKIHLGLEHYSVETSYSLTNLASTETVLVIGFPKTSRRWKSEEGPGAFGYFEAWADKTKIDLTESVDFAGPESDSDESAYVNAHSLRGTVRLGARKTLRIQTKYQAPYTESGDGPGGSWVRFLLPLKQDLAGVYETSIFQIHWASGVCVTTAFTSNEPLINYRRMDPPGVEYLMSNAERQLAEEISFPADRMESEGDLGVYCFRTAVCLGQGLRLRNKPDLQSPTISKILRGASVLVVGRSGENVTIDGKTDSWYLVRTSSGLSGWVFGGYLQIEK